jgi:Na+-driven multidrug efflux pump
MPIVVVVAPAIGLLVNVALNTRLIPVYGIVGASISSTIAYGIMLIVGVAYFQRSRKSA